MRSPPTLRTRSASTEKLATTRSFCSAARACGTNTPSASATAKIRCRMGRTMSGLEMLSGERAPDQTAGAAEQHRGGIKQRRNQNDRGTWRHPARERYDEADVAGDDGARHRDREHLRHLARPEPSDA